MSNKNRSFPHLVIIGNVGYDSIYVDGILQRRFFAGAGYYVSVGASCFTRQVGLVTRINKNDTALANAVRALNISMEGIKDDLSPSPEFKLFYSSGNISSRDISRKVEEFYGCGSKIDFYDIPESFIKSKIFHIAATVPEQQLSWIMPLRARIGNDSIISVDTTEEYIRKYRDDLLKVYELSDMAIINRRETDLLRILKAFGKTILVKKGKDGAEIWNGKELLASCSAPSVPFVDSTGSGDILIGSYLALRLEGHEAESGLEIAVKTASESITQFGVDHLVKKL
jgi:sugar/nucleoside kinase (ribokinase family)